MDLHSCPFFRSSQKENVVNSRSRQCTLNSYYSTLPLKDKKGKHKTFTIFYSIWGVIYKRTKSNINVLKFSIQEWKIENTIVLTCFRAFRIHIYDVFTIFHSLCRAFINLIWKLSLWMTKYYIKIHSLDEPLLGHTSNLRIVIHGNWGLITY